MKYIYSGSWAPLHAGHLAIANYVEAKYNTTVLFEFCKTPYDKPPLSDDEVQKRLNQFMLLGRYCVVSDNTSYVQKSSRKARTIYGLDYPYRDDILFLVGYDTIARIDDPKYYFGSEVERDRCIEIIKKSRASFLVFPRAGHLTTKLSPATMSACQFAPDDFVPVNISSTEVRQKEYKPRTALEEYANRKDFS